MVQCPLIREKEDCKMRKFIIIPLLFVFSMVYAQKTDSLMLVKNGKTLYSIVVQTNKADSAAKLLQTFVDTISGASLPIIQGSSIKKECFVMTSDESLFPTGQCDTIREDGFIIRTLNSNIFIFAINPAGYNNAVYYFLEHSLSCRFYAINAMVMPKHETLTIEPIQTIQNPAFSFRINYNGGAFDAHYAAWQGLNNVPQSDSTKEFEISKDWGRWVHTLQFFVPPSKYFATHPEYFALRNGVRIPDEVCLSNPAVLTIVVEALRAEMAKDTAATFWSVSQGDNFNFCQCDQCRAVNEANGSPSGMIITFVNEVAKVFPDKIISTLAYQYSRKAPTQVKPLPNVNIMLCTIECNRHLPISADSTEGSFRNDLESWGALTDNILVWDYVINFSNIIGPFPNFHVLKPNIQLFRDNHVTMLFEQGWPRRSGEFTELRCYLLSKLMWNPSLNNDSLIHDFCLGYYGPAGKYVEQYVILSRENLMKSGRALTLYEPMSVHADGFLSPENLEIYFSLFDKALLENANREPYQHRIQMAMQPLRYAWLEVAKSMPFSDHWIFEKDENGKYGASQKSIRYLTELCDLAEAHGPSLFHEHRNKPADYRKNMKAYFENGYCKHLALGKPIVFKKNCSPKYAANGPNSLTDGVSGTENYFALWQGWDGDSVDAIIDLGKAETIHGIEVHFLVNQLSWIFLPKSIRVSLSEDGITYRAMGEIELTNANEKRDNEIVPIKMSFDTSKQYRYVRIIIDNIGKIPEWRGIDGNAWLFVDEIIVR